MSTLTIPNSFSAYTKIKSADMNANFTAITTWANGNIDNSNIVAGAAIAYSKLNLALSILNADISASAAIARSKIAAGTVSHVLVNDGSGNFSSEANLAVSRGGTGLGTLTLNNVMLGNGTSNVQFVAPGSSGNVLTSDGTTWASATPTVAPDQSYELSNVSLACSVASSALTIALKGKNGSDPSGANVVGVGMRNVTSATGTYNRRTVTAALSTVISSGSTAGHASGVNHYIYVYLLDNAGTLELAWSSTLYDDGSVVSTTAEGGAGAADSNATMYSTTARTSVPCRLIGRLKSNQVTAGTWAAVPTEISLAPFQTQRVIARYKTSAGQSIANASFTLVDYGTKDVDTHNAVVTGTWKFTSPKATRYLISVSVRYSADVNNANNILVALYKNGSEVIRTFDGSKAATLNHMGVCSGTIIDSAAGDYWQIYLYQDSAGSVNLNTDSTANHISIVELGPF